jgi:cell division protein FtsL
MARKLLIVIFVFTIAALSLLVIRQEQINTVHTMMVLHQQISRQKTSLDTLRFAIEEECSAESLGLFRTSRVNENE